MLGKSTTTGMKVSAANEIRKAVFCNVSNDCSLEDIKSLNFVFSLSNRLRLSRASKPHHDDDVLTTTTTPEIAKRLFVRLRGPKSPTE